MLVAVCALAFVYRSYGGLLALTWNACIWAVVLSTLVARGLDATQTAPVTFVIVSAAALLPHLVLEASAYVIGALAAIYASKAITKYGPRSAELWQVMRAVATLVLFAALTLAAAALVEHLVAPSMLGLVKT